MREVIVDMDRQYRVGRLPKEDLMREIEEVLNDIYSRHPLSLEFTVKVDPTQLPEMQVTYEWYIEVKNEHHRSN